LHFVLVGAGHSGRHLIDPIVKEGHNLTIIEESKELCHVLLRRHKGVLVVNGDGTKLEVLEEAGARTADVLVATMESDGANITIAELAKTMFGIPHIIALINNPKNIKAARQAGASRVICPLEHTISLFGDEIKRIGATTLLRREDKDYHVVEFTVLLDSPLVGKKLKELKFPKKCRIGMVRRGYENLIPDENFSFQAADRLFIYGTTSHVESFIRFLERMKR